MTEPLGMPMQGASLRLTSDVFVAKVDCVKQGVFPKKSGRLMSFGMVPFQGHTVAYMIIFIHIYV